MIAEAVLLDALEGVHSGRLRVHEAYRTIRAAEMSVEGAVLTKDEAASVAMALRLAVSLDADGERLVARLEAAS